jgi:hypothetical protein
MHNCHGEIVLCQWMIEWGMGIFDNVFSWNNKSINKNDKYNSGTRNLMVFQYKGKILISLAGRNK